MNILFLHSSSDLYGASKIFIQTVEYLSVQGHNVIVILSEEGPLVDSLRQKGITVYIIKLGILRRKYFNIKGILNRVVTIYKAKKALNDLVDKYNINVIYSNTAGVFVGALVSRSKKVYHIWHIHEIITQPQWFLKVLGKIIDQYSNQIIMVSCAVKKHWEKYVDKRKIKVIYNGISYNEYLISTGNEIRKELKVSDRDILVGMIGRVHYWKGQQYFLNIAKHLADKHSNLKFVMVGDAYSGYEYLYDELEKTKIKLGIKHLVTDLGYRRDIPQILSALDVFIQPSILPDPLPTVILEAMAAGKPVAATAHGGALEMVEHDKTGVLIPLNDAVKAAEIIEQLISNEQLRKAFGRNGIDRVQASFSQKMYFTNIEKALLRTLS